MSYQVLARKYRPLKFGEVVGQDPIVRTLRNALLRDRLAHAYLFAGPRGVGKTSVARILAKALNCPNRREGDPCNRCDVCNGISAGEDIDVLEIDGASNNGVEEVRSLRESARYSPNRSPHKIYIIDEVHMLSTAAFNALLKTLEEPPPHVLFFFATTDPQKLPATIHSRCQRFNFHQIEAEALVGALKETCKLEGVEVEDGALWAIARRSGGSLRDALSLLDQSLSYGTGTVTEGTVREMLGLLESGEILSILLQVRDGEAAAALRALAAILREGADLSDFLSQGIVMLRDLLLLRVSPSSQALVERSPEACEKLLEEAPSFTVDTLLHYLAVLQEVRAKLRWDSLPRIRVEVALVELSRLPRLESIGDLVDRLATRSGDRSSPRPAPERAEAPEVEPKAVGAPPQAGTEPGDLWKKAVSILREDQPTLGTVLDILRPLSLADGVLTAGCPKDTRGMIDQALGKPARKRAVEDALSQLGFGSISLRIVPLDEGAGPAPVEDHPWVKEARSILGQTKEKKEEHP